MASNADECSAVLSYAVSLKKPGTVTFEYFYPDNSIYFEFFVSVLKPTVGDLDEDGCGSGRLFGDLSLFSPPTSVGSERPVSIYGLPEPLDEDLRGQLEYIQGESECSLSTMPTFGIDFLLRTFKAQRGFVT